MVSNFDLNRTALNNQMMGLSTDTKPTTGILPNSLFWELDTNGMYYFDGTQWQSIGGSGGGGGSSDFSTAQVTIKASSDMNSGMTTPNFNSEQGVNYATYSASEEDYIIPVPLYNGLCTAQFWGELEVTGDIVIDESTLKITGDGTITFTSTGSPD